MIKKTFEKKKKEMLELADEAIRTKRIKSKNFDYEIYKKFRLDYRVPPKIIIDIARNEYGFVNEDAVKNFAKKYREEKE